MGFWSLTKLAQVSSRMPFELVQSGVNAFWLRFVQVLSLQAFAPGWDIVDVHWLGPLPALCEPLGSSYLGLKGATSQPSFTCSNLHTLIWCWGHIPTPPWKKWNYSPWHIWLVVIILQTAQKQLTWIASHFRSTLLLPIPSWSPLVVHHGDRWGCIWYKRTCIWPGWNGQYASTWWNLDPLIQYGWFYHCVMQQSLPLGSHWMSSHSRFATR